MKKFVIFCLVLTTFYIPSALASQCSKEDQEYADFWDNYYSPDGAYAYGLKIQQMVKNEDLQGIFSLVKGELTNGPRKKFIKNKSFNEVFSNEWAEKVLSTEPPCGPVGWRGFMLGNGMIWYNKSKTGGNIVSINGAEEEIIEKPLVGWTIDEKVVHPFCFNRPWWSSDNFEELAEVFSIDDLDQFLKTPGRFMGNPITDFAPIKPSWCSKGDECADISLAAELSQCKLGNFDFEDQDGSVLIKQFDEYDWETQYKYRILNQLNSDKCSELAPNIGVECKESYLLSVGDYSGGSKGWDTSYGLYGLFDLPNMGASIVPLMFFSNKNEAFNYLENNNQKQFRSEDDS